MMTNLPFYIAILQHLLTCTVTKYTDDHDILLHYFLNNKFQVECW